VKSTDPIIFFICTFSNASQVMKLKFNYISIKTLWGETFLFSLSPHILWKFVWKFSLHQHTRVKLAFSSSLGKFSSLVFVKCLQKFYVQPLRTRFWNFCLGTSACHDICAFFLHFLSDRIPAFPFNRGKIALVFILIHNLNYVS
jgi:hypothetical protein